MKREDLKKIEGMTEDQIDAVMKIHGEDVAYWNAQQSQAVSSTKTTYQSKIDVLSGQITDLTSANNELKGQVVGYERRDKVNGAGVDPKFAKFVTSEVSAMVNDQTDFDTALATYIEANPQFKTGQQQVINSGHDIGGSSHTPKQGNALMNDAILSAVGK